MLHNKRILAKMISFLISTIELHYCSVIYYIYMKISHKCKKTLMHLRYNSFI